MALIKTSAIIDSISGKLNGSVFSRNRAGAYIRGKGTIKFKPGTELSDSVNMEPHRGSPQGRIIGTLVEFSKMWRTIGKEAQNAWNNATSDFQKTNVFGDTRTPSGFNLFNGINSTRAFLSSIATSPGKVVLPNADVVPNKIGGPFINYLVVDDIFEEHPDDEEGTTWRWDMHNFVPRTNPTTSADGVLFEFTRPMSAGITAPSKADYRAIEFSNDETPTEGEIDIQLGSRYQSVFGTITESDFGKRIFIRVSSASAIDGQKGEPNYFDFTINPRLVPIDG